MKICEIINKIDDNARDLYYSPIRRRRRRAYNIILYRVVIAQRTKKKIIKENLMPRRPPCIVYQNLQNVQVHSRFFTFSVCFFSLSFFSCIYSYASNNNINYPRGFTIFYFLTFPTTSTIWRRSGVPMARLQRKPTMPET